MKTSRLLLMTALLLVGHWTRAQCPNLTLSVEEDRYCATDSVVLDLAGVPASAVVEWIIGGNYDTSGARYVYEPEVYGLIDVNVRLTLTDGSICTYGYTDVTYIIPPLVSEFAASRLLLCNGPDTVRLADRTAGSVARSWVVAGQTYSNVDSAAIVTVPRVGVHNISLYTTDTSGCGTLTTFYDTLEVVNDIDLNMVIPTYDHCLPTTISYTGQYNSSASIDSVLWSFEGANTPTSDQLVTPAIGYSNPGSYDVGLQVITTNGCVYNESYEDTIKLGEIQNLQLIASSNQVCLSEEMSVDQTLTGIRGVARWTHPKAKGKNRSKYNIDLVYRDTGYHSIFYEVDDLGCISRDSLINFVYARGAQARFYSNNPYNCQVPHTVDMINRSDTISTRVDNYYWAIYRSSDKNLYTTSTLKDPSFTFNTLGESYDVQLVATDSAGCSDTAYAPGFIRVSGFQFDIRPTTQLICTGSEVEIRNRTPKASSATPNRYRWYFLDTDSTTVLDSSDQANPSFSYAQEGKYSVKLVAYNDSGCTDTTIMHDLIEAVDLQISSLISDTSFCYQDSIQVMQNSSPDSIDLVHRWYWMDGSGQLIDSIYSDSFALGFNSIGNYTLRHVQYMQINKQLATCYDTLDHSLLTSGVSGQVIMDTVTGCAPLDIRPRFQANENVHHGDTSDKMNFYWAVYPESGVTSSGVNSADPVFTITEEAGYRVSVFVTNSAGCNFYDQRASTIRVGVDAAFQPLPDTFCVGQEIILENRSRGNPDRLEWIIDSNVNYSIDSIDFDHYRLVFYETGSFPVQLQASKQGGCTDSRNRRYTIIPISTAVELRDTLLYCAPQNARMGVVTNNVDSIIWHFGDGDSLRADLGDVGHWYRSNDSFNVMAVGINSHGCADTVFALQPVVIEGPRARLDWDVSEGCEALEVNFNDRSIGGGTTILDYGDGSPLDSSGANVHTYLARPGEDSSTFTIRIWHRNATGCTDSLIFNNAIKVHALPRITIDRIPAAEICQGEWLSLGASVAFTDSLSWVWNGVQSYKERNINVLPSDSGWQRFVIQAFNTHCSISDSVQSYVHHIPSVQWNGPAELCRDQPMVQRSTSSMPALDSIWIWDLGEPGHPMNDRVVPYDTVVMAYRVEGTHDIKVRAVFNNGCSDSASGSVFVIGPDSIPAMQLDMVTVLDDGSVELQYTTTPYIYLDRLEFRKAGAFLNSTTNVGSGVFRDPSLVNPGSEHCYTAQLMDRCGFSGPETVRHCVVVLSVSSTIHKQIDLTWTPYVGWTDLQAYQVYRLDPGSNQFQLVAQVPPNVLSYADSDLCPGVYNYRIHAIQSGSARISKSNITGARSLYVPNVNFPDIIAATVVDDREVLVNWRRSMFDPGSVYQLEKYKDQKTSPEDIKVVSDTFFVDQEVLVDEHTYRYTVSEWDRCEVQTENGSFGRTILLTGDVVDGVSVLSWSPYEDWAQGVDYYEILFVGAAGMELVTTVGGQQLTYLDRTIHPEDEFGYYHFAVRAVRNDGVTSLSNLIQISGDAVAWIPNAFSPNNDGTNEVFRPHFRFTRNSDLSDPQAFYMEIYNRWGEVVFQTTDRDEGWDGTHFGVDVPQGVYAYRIRTTDVKARVQIHSGTLTLLR